mmetsp:Transcript_16628/g.53146  ORF Transcript_16628/g.53146 Transcript_16628/m.53146 type:complete len:254 (+) Transcript_16628:17-778(+)
MMLLIPIGLAGVVLFSSAATRPCDPHGRADTRIPHSPRASPKCAAEAMPTVDLYAPGTRASYAGNLAGYLVDLHDAKATFNFCGGMMFQLALTDKLRSHLSAVSSRGACAQQPVLHDAGKRRMQQLPGYDKTGAADNVRVFHGREVRQVQSAAGGMGMVLQLSLAGEEEDAEGWTKKELSGYDGWGHDSSRTWNLAREADAFRAKWGAQAVTLQHRFYLHLDAQDNLWLSAEDGCEGYLAAAPPARPKVFGLF